MSEPIVDQYGVCLKVSDQWLQRAEFWRGWAQTYFENMNFKAAQSCGRNAKAAEANAEISRLKSSEPVVAKDTGEILFRGVDGCTHIHYMPRVNPYGCSACMRHASSVK